MPRVAKSSKLVKTATGQHVSARSKTQDPMCSQAMSAWVLGRKAGNVAAGVFKILAQCRAKARQNSQAKLKQASGKLAEGRGTWQRSEKAHALLMGRAAKRQPEQGHMAADAHATKATAAVPLRQQAAAHRAAKGDRAARAASLQSRLTRHIDRAASTDAKNSRELGHAKDAVRSAMDRPYRNAKQLNAKNNAFDKAMRKRESLESAYENSSSRHLVLIGRHRRVEKIIDAAKAGDLPGQTSLLDRVGHDTFKRTPTAADRLAARAEAHGDTPGNRQRRLRELLAARKARTDTAKKRPIREQVAAKRAARGLNEYARQNAAGMARGQHLHKTLERMADPVQRVKASFDERGEAKVGGETIDRYLRQVSDAGLQELAGHAGSHPFSSPSRYALGRFLTTAVHSEQRIRRERAATAPPPARAPVTTSAAAAEAHGKSSERAARIVAAARPPATPEHVRDAILGHANHLLREEHGHTGLVPIHQIRDRVEAHLGPVPHGDFDRHLNDLRREGKLKMLPGMARDLADAEHARKSFAGPGETWFYVETPAAPSAAFKGPGRQAHAPGVVRAAILGHAARLRGEKHHATGLVPIHEVRAAVHADLGPDAAAHDVFDRHVLDLHRDKAARLLPINDATGVSTRQMNDSIHGNNETWFYLEHAGPAAAPPKAAGRGTPERLATATARREARARYPAARPAPPPAEFARHALAAAARVGPAGRFPAEPGAGKVFIHHAHAEYAKTPEGAGVPLGEFKRRLVAAGQAGHLGLARADLVEAMPPRDVAAAETRGFGGAEAHFLRVAPGRPADATHAPLMSEAEAHRRAQAAIKASRR